VKTIDEMIFLLRVSQYADNRKLLDLFAEARLVSPTLINAVSSLRLPVEKSTPVSKSPLIPAINEILKFINLNKRLVSIDTLISLFEEIVPSLLILLSRFWHSPLVLTEGLTSTLHVENL
jgi:hypothetical protein